MKFRFLYCIAVLTIQPAAADEFDRGGVRGDTYCFPAKFAVNIIEDMKDMPATKTDIVGITLAPKFLIYDGGELPQRFFLKSGGKPDIDYTVAEDGSVPDFTAKTAPADTSDEICIHDPARAGIANNDESLYFEMGLTPYFHNRSGKHSLNELEEGAKDGRNHYKKMIPSLVSMFMPKTDHMSIRYDDITVTPDITVVKDGQILGAVPYEIYNKAYVIDCDWLEEQGADILNIKGGSYRIAPVPSIKTMKKYGIGKPRGPQTKSE